MGENVAGTGLSIADDESPQRLQQIMLGKQARLMDFLHQLQEIA